MKNLREYEPLETYFHGRLWWRCAVIRTQTGYTKTEDIVRVVNAPCFIYEHTVEPTSADYMHIPTQPQLNVIVPARYVHKADKSIIVTLDWGPEQDISVGDTVYVHGYPYLLTIQTLNNPLTLYSHYELLTIPRPDPLRLFSTPPIELSSYSYITPPDDIIDEVIKIVEMLMRPVI